MVGSRARAEAFARLLDGGPAAGAPAGLAPLATLAGRLGSLPAPTLPAGLVAGRAALVATATQHTLATTTAAATATAVPTGAATAHGASGALTALGSRLAAVAGKVALPGWAPLAAGGLAAAVGVAGLGVGASRSLPGDGLYGVKRGVESVQLALTTSSVGEAEQRLTQMHARLGELTAVLAQARAGDDVRRLVADWDTGTRDAVAVLLPRIGDPAVAGELVAFVRDSARRMAALGRLAAPEVAPLLVPAVTVLARVDGALARALPGYVSVLPAAAPHTGLVPAVPAVPLSGAPDRTTRPGGGAPAGRTGTAVPPAPGAAVPGQVTPAPVDAPGGTGPQTPPLTGPTGALPTSTAPRGTLTPAPALPMPAAPAAPAVPSVPTVSTPTVPTPTVPTPTVPTPTVPTPTVPTVPVLPGVPTVPGLPLASPVPLPLP